MNKPIKVPTKPFMDPNSGKTPRMDPNPGKPRMDPNPGKVNPTRPTGGMKVDSWNGMPSDNKFFPMTSKGLK